MNLPYEYWRTLSLYPREEPARIRRIIHRRFIRDGGAGDMVLLYRIPLHEMDHDTLLEAAYIIAKMATDKS